MNFFVYKDFKKIIALIYYIYIYDKLKNISQNSINQNFLKFYFAFVFIIQLFIVFIPQKGPLKFVMFSRSNLVKWHGS